MSLVFFPATDLTNSFTAIVRISASGFEDERMASTPSLPFGWLETLICGGSDQHELVDEIKIVTVDILMTS